MEKASRFILKSTTVEGNKNRISNDSVVKIFHENTNTYLYVTKDTWENPMKNIWMDITR